MNDGTSRIFGLLALLIGVWVVTYWLYDPSRPAPITRDERIHDAPAPPPVNLPEPPTLPRSEAAARPDPVPEPRPQEPPRAPTSIVIPPEFDDYTVQKGDRTLQDVALKVYGDRSKWEAIASANPFFSPDKLKPGITVLRIPRDPGNIQGRLVQRPPPDDGNGTYPDLLPVGPGEQPSPPPTPEGWRTYTVQESDTLWGIAKKMYGRGTLAGLIAEANTDVLPDPDRLRAGITLKIPPAPPAD